VDSHGDLFYREDIFNHRIGPSRNQINHAAAIEWEKEELDALRHGLRDFAGPEVLERIILKYCGKRCALYRFNVTEIAVKSAELKRIFTAYREDGGEVVEDWIRNIPDWTNVRVTYGKENEVADDRDEEEMAVAGAV
jgi:hypothetical protein